MYNGPEHYLDRDAASGRFMAHARLLLQLSRHFETIAPAAFQHSARVANYKSGKIVIHTDNGAVAAKIRQMSQRLCSELSKGGAECNGIEVKVQPCQKSYQSTTSSQMTLSPTACGVLRSTAELLPKGPLQEALANLLASAAKRA